MFSPGISKSVEKSSRRPFLPCKTPRFFVHGLNERREPHPSDSLPSVVSIVRVPRGVWDPVLLDHTARPTHHSGVTALRTRWSKTKADSAAPTVGSDGCARGSCLPYPFDAEGLVLYPHSPPRYDLRGSFRLVLSSTHPGRTSDDATSRASPSHVIGDHHE